jgi:hypothetical protein
MARGRRKRARTGGCVGDLGATASGSLPWIIALGAVGVGALLLIRKTFDVAGQAIINAEGQGFDNQTSAAALLPAFYKGGGILDPNKFV